MAAVHLNIFQLGFNDMEFFKHNTMINFMAQRKWAAIISDYSYLFYHSWSLAIHGLNWGLDFTGGTQIQLSYQARGRSFQIRSSLEKAGFPDAVVISYGTSKCVGDIGAKR